MSTLLSLLVLGLLALLCRDLIAATIKEVSKEDGYPIGLSHLAVTLVVTAVLLGPMTMLPKVVSEQYLTFGIGLLLGLMLLFEERWRPLVDASWQRLLRGEASWLKLFLIGCTAFIATLFLWTFFSTSTTSTASYPQSESKAWYLYPDTWFYLGLVCAGIAALAIYLLAESNANVAHGKLVVELFGIALAFCWGFAILLSFFDKIGFSKFIDGSSEASSLFTPFL
jgi:hypothetical protein